MSGYYILAIVAIAVAAGLVIAYHIIRFVSWWKNEADFRKDNVTFTRITEDSKIEFVPVGYSEKTTNVVIASNKRYFKKFVIGIIIMTIIGVVMLGIGARFEGKSEKELVKYQTRYTTVMTFTSDDFYKYCGDQIAKETVDLAEWIKTTNWSIERYGRFSPYWSLRGRVHLNAGE